MRLGWCVNRALLLLACLGSSCGRRVCASLVTPIMLIQEEAEPIFLSASCPLLGCFVRTVSQRYHIISYHIVPVYFPLLGMVSFYFLLFLSLLLFLFLFNGFDKMLYALPVTPSPCFFSLFSFLLVTLVFCRLSWPWHPSIHPPSRRRAFRWMVAAARSPCASSCEFRPSLLSGCAVQLGDVRLFGLQAHVSSPWG